jgi:hypothetical protein
MNWKGNPQWGTRLGEIVADGLSGGEVPTWAAVAAQMNTEFKTTGFTKDSVRSAFRRMEKGETVEPVQPARRRPPRAAQAHASIDQRVAAIERQLGELKLECTRLLNASSSK